MNIRNQSSTNRFVSGLSAMQQLTPNGLESGAFFNSGVGTLYPVLSPIRNDMCNASCPSAGSQCYCDTDTAVKMCLCGDGYQPPTTGNCQQRELGHHVIYIKLVPGLLACVLEFFCNCKLTPGSKTFEQDNMKVLFWSKLKFLIKTL